MRTSAYPVDHGFGGESDPKAWTSLRLAVPDDVSAVHFDALVSPDRSAFVVNPPDRRSRLDGTIALVAGFYKFLEGTLTVSPRTWPDLRRFDHEIYLTTLSPRFQVDVLCDRAPRLARPELPVFPEDQRVELQLETIGGVPPIQFTHGGLPLGFTLTSGGLLTSIGASERGASTIDITLTDALGAASTDTYDLHLGDTGACGRLTPRLDCDDELVLPPTREITTTSFCTSSTLAEHDWIAVNVAGDGAYRLGAEPWLPLEQDEPRSVATTLLDRTTWPPLDVLEQQVGHWTVEHAGEEKARVSVTCGPKRAP